MDRTSYFLPGGYVDEAGAVYRHVELAPLSGREEEFLAQHREPAPARLVTAILSRCVRSIGAISPLTEEVAHRLLVADRQYLLLKLRQITFGDQVKVTVVCPLSDCGEKINLDFSIENIPVRASEDRRPTYEMKLSPEASLVSDHGEKYSEVIFRLPNGEDQEIISPFLAEHGESGSTMLLMRCIQKLGPVNNPGNELLSGLSPLARMEIESQMETLAPKVDLTLAANCPECGREFAMPFDFRGFFFGELRTSQDLLCREVHYLAYHYHWSEREIMEMPREKRRRYIEVLAGEIERLNNAI